MTPPASTLMTARIVPPRLENPRIWPSDHRNDAKVSHDDVTGSDPVTQVTLKCKNALPLSRRWGRAWLHACAAAPMSNLTRTLNSPQRLIREGQFARAGSADAGWLGRAIRARRRVAEATFFLRGVRAFQLPLRFHQPFLDELRRPGYTAARAGPLGR